VLWWAAALENACPFLVNTITAATSSLVVLDIGAGSGRDAVWIFSKGHNVLAVEQSSSMLTIAKNLHPSERITCLKSELPRLDHLDASMGSLECSQLVEKTMVFAARIA